MESKNHFKPVDLRGHLKWLLQIGNCEKWLWLFPRSGEIQFIHQETISETKKKVWEIESLGFIYDIIDAVRESRLKLIWENWMIIETFYDLEAQIKSLSKDWIGKVSSYVNYYYDKSGLEIQRQLTTVRHILDKHA